MHRLSYLDKVGKPLDIHIQIYMYRCLIQLNTCLQSRWCVIRSEDRHGWGVTTPLFLDTAG